MAPGARISRSRSGGDSLNQLKDQVAGVSREQKYRRETYFMAESYIEYFPKSGSGYGGGPSRAGVKPVYLIVWWSPNGGTIHRIAMNEDEIVPFANYDFYPNPGYFFSMSMPEKIRNIQEKANYADKQNTDAMDRIISPALFFSDTAELEKSRAKRMPGGMYNIGRDNQVFYEPMPARERGFEQEVKNMWVEAQQMVGLIDISYGSQAKDQTLGQTQMRSFRADIRFQDLLDRYEMGFKDTMDLIYHYDNKFMDRSTKIKVLGYSDYKRIEEIFPSKNLGAIGLGITGKYDFSFGGASVLIREQIKNDEISYFSIMMTDPMVLANPKDSWNIRVQLGQAYGIREGRLETILTKPKEALILSAQEAIQRVVSGQTGIDIRPGIDTESYIFELELFGKTDTFASLEPEGQMEILRLLKLAMLMSAAEKRAIMDVQMVQSRQMMAQQQQMDMAGAERGQPAE